MDSGATIVGVIVLLICVIPFVLLSRNSRKRKQEMLDRLFRLADQKNCKISQYDIWNNSAVGIDDTARWAFFTRKVNGAQTEHRVNLTEVQKCRMINSTGTVSRADGNHKIIEKLELAFSYRDKNKGETVLEFYNRDFDSPTLSGELQVTEKWGKIFSDTLSAISR